MQTAVFLDADGVLNVAPIVNDKPAAPTSVDQLIIPPSVKPALEKLKAAGYLLIGVTNKPDIERGLMTQAQADAIFNKLRNSLPLDDFFICYHEKSDCYKPKPGMLLAAAKQYHIDLPNSFLIGDRWRDIGAGQNAGCKTIWIDRGYNEKKPDPPADHTVTSFKDAIEWILAQ